MPPKKEAVPAKREASDASISMPPPGKRIQVSDPAASKTDARREPGLHLQTPTKRSVPCSPCLEALSTWTPGDGEPGFCLEGESGDTCARCGQVGDVCAKPSGFLSAHAYILHSQLHIGAGAANIAPEQKAIQEFLRQSRPAQSESTIHKASLKAFRHGVESALALVDNDKALKPKLTSFRWAAVAMASLQDDQDEQVKDSRRKSVCLGAETAMILAKGRDNTFDMGGFRKGAEAVAALSSDGGAQHRVQLEGFCQGADSMARLIGGSDDARGSSSNIAGAGGGD